MQWGRATGRRPSASAGPGRGPVRVPAVVRFALPDTGLFGNRRDRIVRVHPAQMTISDMVGMLATYSAVITAEPRTTRRPGWPVRGRALEERFPDAGRLDVPMRAWCWRADSHSPRRTLKIRTNFTGAPRSAI